MKVITEFKQKVLVNGVPPNILRTVNFHLAGKESFPLNQEVPDFIKRVHHKLAMGHYLEVTIQVMEDGSLVIKKDG